MGLSIHSAEEHLKIFLSPTDEEKRHGSLFCLRNSIQDYNGYI